MRSHTVRAPLTALIAALLAGCAGGSDAALTQPTDQIADFVRRLGGAPATFVLDQIESQTATPIVTFDHVCQGRRYQHRVFDTITVWPSGQARRAFTLEFLTDGAVRSASHMSFVGTWSPLTRTDYYYFSNAPSLVLALDPVEGGVPMSMLVRTRADGAVTSLQGVGGSCPGSPNDGHEVEAVYSRR